MRSFRDTPIKRKLIAIELHSGSLPVALRHDEVVEHGHVQQPPGGHRFGRDDS